MKSEDISLFDLTPPEKLQLVEDLWDDLAALPSESLFMNGKNKSYPDAKPT